MKRRNLLAVGLLLMAGALLQAAQTLTGTVSDSMCGAKHMMANTSAAECTKACVKDGSDYALVVGDKVYTLKGDTKSLDKYAGKTVTVSGQPSGLQFTVSSVAAK